MVTILVSIIYIENIYAIFLITPFTFRLLSFYHFLKNNMLPKFFSISNKILYETYVFLLQEILVG